MAAILDWKSCGNVYNDIQVAQHSVDWFLIGYQEGSKNRLGLMKKGEGELNELNQYLTEEMVAFGYMKVYDNTQDMPGTDPDFIHITFIGKRVKSQERARAVIHRLEVHQAFPRFIIEFEANCKEELQMDRVRREIADMKVRLAQ
jgi:hypothetical protein